VAAGSVQFTPSAMLLLHSLVACLFFIPSIYAASREAEHAQLVKLAAANDGVVKLDSTTYKLLTSSKRDWTSSVQLTALDSAFRCAPCREFDPAFAAVGKAWSTVSPEVRNTHFFASLDFKDGQDIFRELGLNSAPVVHYYPATEGPRLPASGKTDAIAFDFSYGYDAEGLVAQLNRYTPIPIPYNAPIDWARWGTFAALGLATLLTIRIIWPLLSNRWTWAVFSILTSLIMTGGFMFTKIRGMPYTGHNGETVAAGFSNQYGQEVHVVAGTYGLLATSVLMLAVVVPRQTSEGRQRAQVYIWTMVMVVVNSALLALFRQKKSRIPVPSLFVAAIHHGTNMLKINHGHPLCEIRVRSQLSLTS